ncbi:DUF3344 domain-containing protein [Pseudobacillus badius]|uniref:DUF3344 domain-containing protein n=1 Tax=Bacillus badius TaxID=1455 RepID=UPI003CEB5079
MNKKNNGGLFLPDSIKSADAVSALDVPLTEFFRTFQNGDYEAAGVGLRDNNTGTILIALPASSTITDAFLYWEALENADTLSNTGTLNGTPITGELIATSEDLCWGREVTHYFRADVTGIAVEGNNIVEITPGGGETLLEGASLVVVYSNPSLPAKTIIINDGGVAVVFEPVSTTFDGFFASNAPVEARTTYIVGDGQPAPDQAFFNGTEVAGPDAFIGADGRLWDTLTIDVSTLVSPSETTATAEIRSQGDCLGWIAQVFSVTQTCPPCDNTVDFCADLLIPAPFDFTALGSSAIDVSGLQCCLEMCEATATVPTPCDSTLICPVDISFVRALGSVRVYLNAEGINPDNEQTANFCGNTTVSVDNVLCYGCATDFDPCVDGFFNTATVTDVAVSDTVTTACGNTLVSVTGTINLPSR